MTFKTEMHLTSDFGLPCLRQTGVCLMYTISLLAKKLIKYTLPHPKNILDFVTISFSRIEPS
jgi:hypothetical protein